MLTLSLALAASRSTRSGIVKVCADANAGTTRMHATPNAAAVELWIILFMGLPLLSAIHFHLDRFQLGAGDAEAEQHLPFGFLTLRATLLLGATPAAPPPRHAERRGHSPAHRAARTRWLITREPTFAPDALPHAIGKPVRR